MSPPTVGIAVTLLGRPDLFAKALASWRKQTRSPSALAVSDCSSEEGDRVKIRGLVAEVVNEVAPHYSWSSPDELPRSVGRTRCCQAAANLGAKLVICTESDILFPENLIELALAEFGDPPARLFVDTGIVLVRHKNEKDVVKRQNKSGACQIFRVEDFLAVGGYNPFLVKWGYEDTDFRNRMLASGCEQRFLDTKVVHQWHPTSERSRAGAEDNKKIAASTYWTGTEWKMR